MAVLLFADGQNNKRLFSYFLAKGEVLSPFKRSHIAHVQWNAQPEFLLLRSTSTISFFAITRSNFHKARLNDN